MAPVLCVEPVRPAGEDGYRLVEVEGIKVYLKECINIGDQSLMVLLDKFLWFKKLRVLGITS